MNPLAAALADSLPRLLPGAPSGEPLLLAAVSALSDALERGELALDLEAAAPECVPAEAWPQQLLETLEASGWLAAAAALEQQVDGAREAVVDARHERLDGGRLGFRGGRRSLLS